MSEVEQTNALAIADLQRRLDSVIAQNRELLARVQKLELQVHQMRWHDLAADYPHVDVRELWQRCIDLVTKQSDPPANPALIAETASELFHRAANAAENPPSPQPINSN